MHLQILLINVFCPAWSATFNGEMNATGSFQTNMYTLLDLKQYVK